jgi:hypothetical protein
MDGRRRVRARQCVTRASLSSLDDDDDDDDDEAEMQHRTRAVLSVVIVAALCASVASFARQRATWSLGDDDVVAWMSRAPARDAALGALTLPGTHDSATHYLSENLQPGREAQLPEWARTAVRLAEALRIPADQLVRRWAKAQTLSVGEQLERGIRYVDVRAGWNRDLERWAVHHALTGAAVDEVMEEIKTFLVSAPSEVVVVELTHFFGDPTPDDVERLALMVDEVFGNMTARYRAGKSSLFERTVGEMAEANDRVVVVFEDDDVGRRHGFWPRKTITNTYANTDNFSDMMAFNHDVVSAFNDVNYDASAILKTSWTLTTQAKTVVASLNVFEKNPHSLLELAEWKANGHLSAFADDATRDKCSIGNIVVVDDLEHSDVVAVALRLNAVGIFPKGQCKWIAERAAHSLDDDNVVEA